MPHLSPALSSLVEHAYSVFDEPRPRGALHVCRCNVCVAAETERMLVATPLREIASDLLADYTNSAHEWNEVAERELRYFLPRYLDLIASDEPPCHLGIDVCLRRLSEAHWRSSWPSTEIALLDAFFVEILLAHLQQLDTEVWPAGARLVRDVSETLTFAITAGASLDSLLTAWLRCDSPGAAVHLAAQRMDLIPDKEGGWRPSTSFLDEFRTEARRIGDFISDPAHKRRLEWAFFELTDEALQKIVSDALTLYP